MRVEDAGLAWLWAARRSRTNSASAGERTSSRQLGLRRARDLARGAELRPREQADVVAVVPAHHGVHQQRRGGGERRDPQVADGDEGAGQQLEVLDHAAVEDQALVGIVGVLEPTGVAGAVPAVLVERGGGRVRLAEVAGRDVRALHAHLELVVDRRELDLDARHRARRSRPRGRSGSARRWPAARSRSGPTRRSSSPARRAPRARRSPAASRGPAAARRRRRRSGPGARRTSPAAPRRAPGTAAARRSPRAR